MSSSAPPLAESTTIEDLPLARPDLTDLERRYVMDVIESGRLALGPQLETFERLMARQCETKHAIAVSSGTAALHCIVRGLGIGEGDEVITTPYSFIASANVAVYEDARPVFVDVDPVTFNIDPNRIEDTITPRTRAVLGVDVFGCPADWAAIEAIAERHNLLLIDDACEALGARLRGKAMGSWGHAAAFGFYPNKQITTGEGGCITTDDHELAERCRSLRNQGRSSRERMQHVRLGFNYRLDEISAALGRAQMERLPSLLDARASAARRYMEHLEPLQDDLLLPDTPADAERSWFVFVVRLADHWAESARDQLMKGLQQRGIATAAYFPAIHRQPFYRNALGLEPGSLPVCEATSVRTLALPFYPALPEQAPARVARALKDLLPALPRA